VTRPFDFETLTVGEQLPSLCYEVTQAKLAAFQEATSDPAAAMVTIAAKEYAYTLWAAYDEVLSVNAKHEAWYRQPPVPGDVITATATVADKYVRRGRRYVVIATQSTNQAGVEICHNRVTLLIGGIDG
jgi:acyl dehydratase